MEVTDVVDSVGLGVVEVVVEVVSSVPGSGSASSRMLVDIQYLFIENLLSVDAATLAVEGSSKPPPIGVSVVTAKALSL